MKFKGDFKKIRFFATIGLSAMAMVVATIGTFAWFQAKSSGADPRHEVEAGNAGVSISDVKGYKYKYTPRDISTIDYSTGATAEYDLTNPSEKATNNHQAEADPIDSDVPDDGVGYYVVFSGSDYKYSGGKKMSTNDIGDDKALLTNVPLTENTFFDIRRHYYVKVDNVVSTKNEIVPLSLDGSSSGVNSTKQADTGHNSELHWKVTTTGSYDIYINSSENLYVEATTSKAKSASYIRTPSPKRAIPHDGSNLDGSYTDQSGTASASSVFLDTYSTSNGWPKDSARICVHWWNDSNEGLIKMKVHNGAIYFANLPSGIKGYRFVRLDSSSWYYLDGGHLWNYTSDITDSGKRAGCLYKMENFTDRSWQTLTTTGGAVTTTDSYYVLGGMNSWTKNASYLLTASSNTFDGMSFTHKLANVSLTSEVEFKIGTNVHTATTAKTVKYYEATLWTVAASSSDAIVWDDKPEGNWNTLAEPGGYSKDTYLQKASEVSKPNIKTRSAFTANIYFNNSTSSTYVEIGYSVTLNTNSGTINSGNVTTYSYGIGATLPTDVARDGYAFAGWYVDENLTGDRVTSIGTSETGNKTYYAKWVSKASGNTYYATVDTGCAWAGIKVFVFSSSFVPFGYTFEASAASPYENVYSFTIPTDTADGFLLFDSAESSPSGNKQTGNIMASGNLNSDSFGGAASDYTDKMIHIVSETDGNSNRKWEWMGFVDKPTTDGYYISTNNTWGSITMDTVYVPGANTAIKMAHTVAASFKFQIWKIKNNNWYIYHTLAAACSAAAIGAKLSISTAGTYDFYLNSNNAIYVTGHDVKKIEFSKLDGQTPAGDTGKFAMHVGDASMVLSEPNVYSGNRYAYEQTISVKAGDTFTITEGAGARSNVQLAIDSTAADYVEGTGDAVDGKYSSFRIRLNGSYTFYWTTGTPNKLAIAPIPDLGFGYYILKNQNQETPGEPAFSYGSCVKMQEVDSNESYANRAYYYSYYAQEGEVLAFRSYVDEVDTYYDNANGYFNDTSISGKTASNNSGAYPVNATDHEDASASAKQHGIVIKDEGYYNFYIYWNSSTSKYEIRITTGDTASTFFKLNNINSSNAGSDNAVKGQNTAFVLAVTFTANNPYATDIYANAMVSSSCNLRFTALLDTNIRDCTSANEIYTTIKDAAYTKNSWSTCANGSASKGGSLAASNSDTHTLYIVIDYTPGSTITAYSGILSFAVRAAQA